MTALEVMLIAAKQYLRSKLEANLNNTTTVDQPTAEAEPKGTKTEHGFSEE